MNFLAVYLGYCPEAPRRASAPQTIRMLFRPPTNTVTPTAWLVAPALHPSCCFCSQPGRPGPPPASTWARGLTSGTERARREEGKGWALESYLLGSAPVPCTCEVSGQFIIMQGLSFLIGRGETHTLAVRDFVGNTWGNLWRSKGELVAEGVQFSPLPSSLPAGGHGPLAGTSPRRSTLGERSPEETRGSPPGCPAHSVSVAVSDDFNLQSRRILNLHKIKNYIIYVSGNGKRSGASSDPALWEEHQNN